MKNLNCILSSLICLFIMQATFAQNVSNVRVSTTDKDVLVTYDLIGEPNTAYMVDLDFKMDDGKRVQAKSIKGDVGEVLVGKDKVAIWKVYQDVNGIKGGIEPIFDVKELPTANVSIDNQPDVVEPTPTPPNSTDDRPIIDVIDEEINGRKRSRTGIKVSLGNSRVSVSRGVGEFSREFSWEGGLYHRYNFNRKLYIQPELLYHRQRYDQRIDDERRRYTHNQVRGQVIGGVKPIGLGLYFNAGLYYAYQFNGNEEVSQDGNSIETQFSDFPERNGETEPFDETDFGYILGGTLSFNRGGFALSLLFSQSFNSVVNAAYFENDPVNDGLSFRHQSFHFVIQKRF